MDYFSYLVRCTMDQWLTLKVEGSNDAEDMEEFEDDDIDNVVQNLRQPNNIFHAEILT